MWKLCKSKGLIMRQKKSKIMRPLCALKIKIMQSHCKFILAQQPANNFYGKVEYCDLKNQGNTIHWKIKKQLICASRHSFIIKLYQLE